MPESMKPPSQEEFTKLAEELATILGRYHPHVQGAAIAAMLTNWLGRTPPEQRELAFRKLLKSVFASIDGLQNLAKESEHTSRQSH